jgi:membrane-bound lytic murein transglycosylase D
MVEYKNAKGKTLAEVGSEISWDVNELKRYNSWVLGSKIPNDKEYSVAILVPSDQYDDMIAKINRKGSSGIRNEAGFPVLQRISPESVADGEPILYVINGKKGIMASAGDDVGQIAKKGKVKPTDFLKFNDMSDKDLVEEGKVYYLQSKNRKAKVKFHNVSENESLWDISQIYGVRLRQLLKFNRMESVKRLQSGRVVYLQSKRPKNQPVEYVQENDAPATDKVVPAKDKRKDKKVEEETTVKNSEKPVVWEEETKDKKRGNTPKKSTTEDEDDTYIRLEPQEREKERKEEVIKIEEPVVTKTKEQKPPIVEIENSDTIIAYEEKPKNNKPTNTPKSTQPKPVENTTEAVKPKPVVEKPKESTTTTAKPASYGSSYEVQQGETLFAIARKTGIYVRDLATWNNMTLEDKVKVGQVLTLVNPNVATASKATATKTVQPKEEAKAKVGETVYHLVAKGETLYSISRKYGVSTKQIQDWNGMNDNNVRFGQKLIVKK